MDVVVVDLSLLPASRVAAMPMAGNAAGMDHISRSSSKRRAARLR
jgi:hypothetical protein